MVVVETPERPACPRQYIILRLANVTKEEVKKTYWVAFLGHTDAAETT